MYITVNMFHETQSYYNCITGGDKLTFKQAFNNSLITVRANHVGRNISRDVVILVMKHSLFIFCTYTVLANTN